MFARIKLYRPQILNFHAYLLPRKTNFSKFRADFISLLVNLETFCADYISQTQSIKNIKNLKTCYHELWLTKLKSSHVLLLRFNIFRERKTQEKSKIFIRFYYLDIFPHILRGINFVDVGISCRLNFAGKDFLIFWPIIYLRKDQNLQNSWNITVMKNRPLKVRHQKLNKG